MALSRITEAVASFTDLTIGDDLTLTDDFLMASDASIIKFGADADVTLTHVHNTGLLLNSTSVIQFNDSSQNIGAPNATTLDINATDEIELNATLVDVNANLDVSGTIVGASTVSAGTAFVPDAADGAALGTTSLEFSDLFLADGAVISLGNDQDVTLTHVADTGILLNGTSQLQFNDASQNINAPSATVLDINATDEIELNATLVDVNANLDVSGTYTGGGLMTTGGNIVIPDAGNIGSASDTDAIAIAANGVVTFSQNPVFPDGGIAIADLDIDGASDIGEAIVDADLFIIDNGAGGTNRKVAASRIKTYIGSLSAAADDITAGDAAVNLTTTSGNITIDAQGNDTDIIFKGTDGSSDTTFLTIDGSDAGAAAFNNSITYSGDLISSTSGTSNFRAGVNAGDAIQSGGNYNVVVGDEAGTALTTGDANVAVGFEALKTEDAHGHNTAVGYIALKNLNAGANGNNVAVGFSAGGQMTTGVQNTIVGASAGDALTDADFNVAIGMEALSTDTLGSRSTAVGKGTLKNQNFTSATDAYNVAIGYEAGNDITTATLNTLVGSFSGDAMTTGGGNVGVGYLTLSAETTGQRNTAMGYSALANQNNTGGEQAYNTAYGFFAGLNITTGVQNTLIGSLTGDALTVGDNNTAIGYGALSLDTKGERSVALGINALASQNFTSATESKNTAIGMFCLDTLTTGTQNTALGYNSGGDMTTGSKNTIIGSFTGNQDSLDIRTASNYVVLSDGDGNLAAYRIGNSGGRQWHLIADADSDIGFAVKNKSSTTPYGVAIQFTNEANNDGNQYFLACSDSSATRLLIKNNGNVENQNNSYGSLSDVKLKEQITDASSQWDDIKALKIRKYKMKEDVAKGDSDDLWRLGVVAQELETADMNGLVEENTDRDEEMKDLGTTTKSVKYSVLYMKAVKALQEAMTRIETLETEVKALKGE